MTANPVPSTGIPYWEKTIPPGCVVGRTRGGAGPMEAIPFDTLYAELLTNLNVQTVTGSGTTGILFNTNVLIFNKTSASVSPCVLPTVFARNKVELQIYDWSGLAGDITLTAFGTEKIMGATGPWVIGSGGLAQTGGSLRMLPLADLSGWVVR